MQAVGYGMKSTRVAGCEVLRKPSQLMVCGMRWALLAELSAIQHEDHLHHLTTYEHVLLLPTEWNTVLIAPINLRQLLQKANNAPCPSPTIFDCWDRRWRTSIVLAQSGSEFQKNCLSCKTVCPCGCQHKLVSSKPNKQTNKQTKPNRTKTKQNKNKTKQNKQTNKQNKTNKTKQTIKQTNKQTKTKNNTSGTVNVPVNQQDKTNKAEYDRYTKQFNLSPNTCEENIIQHAHPNPLRPTFLCYTSTVGPAPAGLIIPSPPPYCMHKSEKETKTLGGVALPCTQIPLQLLAYNSQLTSAHQNWETKTQQSCIVRHILHSAHPASLTAPFLSKRPLDEAWHQGDRSANEFLAFSLFPPLLRATMRRIMPIISLKKKAGIAQYWSSWQKRIVRRSKHQLEILRASTHCSVLTYYTGVLLFSKPPTLLLMASGLGRPLLAAQSA